MHEIRVFINSNTRSLIFSSSTHISMQWIDIAVPSVVDVCEVDCWQSCRCLTATDSLTQTMHCYVILIFFFGAAEDDSRESRINILHLLKIVQVLFAFNAHVWPYTWTWTISLNGSLFDFGFFFFLFRRQTNCLARWHNEIDWDHSAMNFRPWIYENTSSNFIEMPI